jgi:hypothetical protein
MFQKLFNKECQDYSWSGYHDLNGSANMINKIDFLGKEGQEMRFKI